MRAGEVVWVCADACEDVSANAGAGVSTGERVRTGAGGGVNAGVGAGVGASAGAGAGTSTGEGVQMRVSEGTDVGERGCGCGRAGACRCWVEGEDSMNSRDPWSEMSRLGCT